MKLQFPALLCCTLTLAAASAIAHAESEPVPYRYSVPLNIHKVIAMNETTTDECKVIDASIKYLDKAGELKNVSYRKMSNACLFQN